MTGLDTNVLVRYLTQDDPQQSRKANGVIDDAAARGERLQVDSVTLCELVWVLRGAYDCDRATVATALGRLLGSAHFAFDEGVLLREALAFYAGGPGDFADYVLGLRNRRSGCRKTATFDRALRGSDLFQLL